MVILLLPLCTATHVALNLNAGDHVPQGSTPANGVSPDGWGNLRTLGLTNSSRSNPRKWVRFHALNEHAGGPGDDAGNLTSTTQEANHNGEWSDFETELKRAVPDEGEQAAQPVAFAVDIGYPGSANTRWVRVFNNNEVITDAADYPNDVNATLDVNGVRTAAVHLDAGDGLYGPEYFKRVPRWKRKKVAGAAYNDKNDEHAGAAVWAT